MQIKEQQHENRGLPFVETTLQDVRYGAARAAQEPGLRAGRDRDAGDRHRRRHRGLQRRRRGADAAAALHGAGRAGADLRDQPAAEVDAQHRRAGQLRRLADAQQELHRHRRLRAVQHQRQRRRRRLPHRLRRAARAEGARRQRQPVPAARRARRCSDGPSPKTNSGKDDRASRSSATACGSRRSAAIPAIVGRTITLSGRGYDVVGVMPRTFFFPGRDVQLWMPFGYTPQLVAHVAAAALARRRRPAEAGRVVRAGARRHERHRDAARAAVSGHQHADGRAARTAARQLRDRDRARRC